MLDKYPRQQDATIAAIIWLMGLPLIFLTLVPNIYCYYVLLYVYGIGAGAVSIATNVCCLEIWRGREDGGPAMYAIDFGFAIGTMIGPQLATPALQVRGGLMTILCFSDA